MKKNKQIAKVKKWRQGDLIIKEVSQIPKGLTKKDNRILIEGGSGGRDHVLSNGNVYSIEEGMILGYFELKAKANIVHQNKDGSNPPANEWHKNIQLPRGKYLFKRQKTYLPEGYELVAD